MKDIIYSCHQPNFIPWLGYFHKIAHSDVFVILDEVQYTKNSVANRNKIKSINGEQLITIPIIKKVNGSSFFPYSKAIIADSKWYDKFFKTLDQNYNKSPFYNQYKHILFELFMIGNFSEMNIKFIKFILLEFEIKTEIVLLSKLSDISGAKNNLLISIGNSIGANIYLSGIGARSYTKEEEFENKNISVLYQDFKHPKYFQLFSPFTPYLSVLDLLFNEGKDGAKFIVQNNV